MRTLLLLCTILSLAACDPPLLPPGMEGEAEAEGIVEGTLEGAGEGTVEGGGEGAIPEGEPGIGECIGTCSFSVVNTYPHDPAAFTQGLVFDGGFLYEGTGQTCCSQLRRVDLTTGQVLAAVDVAEDFCSAPLPTCGGRMMTCVRAASVFGEGIVIVGDRIIQLTWQDCLGLVYDKNTLTFVNAFSYDHEGWGITHDGARLIVSDGTSLLRFWDPNTFAEVGRVRVRRGGADVAHLNELEFIEGYVYANVWQTDEIVKIDPASGAVVATIDLRSILPPSDRTPQTNVLNGIAWDAAGQRLFVTGKNWPKLFEIQLIQLP